MKPHPFRTASLALAALPCLLWPASAPAPIPDGSIELPFEGEIIDLSRFQACETTSQLGLDLELCMDVEMESDGRGRYSGVAELEFSGDVDGILDGPASGSVNCSVDGAASHGKAKFGFAAAGALEALGYTFDPSEVRVRCRGPVAPAGIFNAFCKVRVKLCLDGRCAGAGAKAVFDDDLGIGPWTLTLDAEPIDETTFAGSAEDSMDNVYDMRGRYSEESDTSKVVIRGRRDTPSKGAKVLLDELTADGSAIAKYKVNGCKGFEELD